MRVQTIGQIFATINAKMLERAAKAEPDPTRRQQLVLIQGNWDSLKAWVLGAKVHDGRTGTDKVAVGMIPLDETVLKLFLDAGWNWGGDWSKVDNRKDYMHFEDEGAIDQVKI